MGRVSAACDCAMRQRPTATNASTLRSYASSKMVSHSNLKLTGATIAMKGIEGKRLTYRRLTRRKKFHADLLAEIIQNSDSRNRLHAMVRRR